MASFKNKDADENGMPPEVHEFYKAEHRERVGIAWLLAFVTLVITVGVALGGFSAGRAIYRKVTKNSKSSPTVQVATKASTDTSSPLGKSPSSNSGSTSHNSSSNSSNAKPKPVNSGAVTKPKPAPTPKPTPKPSKPAPSTTPVATAPAKKTSVKSDLPNTGPGDTVAIFIGVTTLATFGHMIYTRHKLEKTLV